MLDSNACCVCRMSDVFSLNSVKAESKNWFMRFLKLSCELGDASYEVDGGGNRVKY